MRSATTSMMMARPTIKLTTAIVWIDVPNMVNITCPGSKTAEGKMLTP